MSTDEYADEFTFFLRLVEPAITNLPEVKDRRTAKSWMDKFSQMHDAAPETEPYAEYLKLLLYAAQRDKLYGIFEKPPTDAAFQQISKKQTAIDMMSLAMPSSKESSRASPIHASAAENLCEYIAIQEIPDFGIQGYYATSTEPLPTWTQQRYDAKSVKTNFTCFRNTHKKVEHEQYEQQFVAISDETLPSNVMEESFSGKRASHISAGNKLNTHVQPMPLEQLLDIETRPCWGRSHYFERLINKPSHIIEDVSVAQTDALLYLIQDGKIKEHNRIGEGCDSRNVSLSRRQVEHMLDLPPCASTPDEKLFKQKAAKELALPSGRPKKDNRASEAKRRLEKPKILGVSSVDKPDIVSDHINFIPENEMKTYGDCQDTGYRSGLDRSSIDTSVNPVIRSLDRWKTQDRIMDDLCLFQIPFVSYIYLSGIQQQSTLPSYHASLDYSLQTLPSDLTSYRDLPELAISPVQKLIPGPWTNKGTRPDSSNTYFWEDGQDGSYHYPSGATRQSPINSSSLISLDSDVESKDTMGIDVQHLHAPEDSQSRQYRPLLFKQVKDPKKTSKHIINQNWLPVAHSTFIEDQQ